MRFCSCESVAVDGGLDYFSVTCKQDAEYKSLVLDLPVNKSMLYQDWAHNGTKYGCIKNYPINEYIKPS